MRFFFFRQLRHSAAYAITGTFKTDLLWKHISFRHFLRSRLFRFSICTDLNVHTVIIIIKMTSSEPGLKSGCCQQQAGSCEVCGSMFNLLCSGCQFSCQFKPLDIRWKSIQSSLSPMWSPCGQNTKATTQSRTAYASFVVGKKCCGLHCRTDKHT